MKLLFFIIFLALFAFGCDHGAGSGDDDDNDDNDDNDNDDNDDNDDTGADADTDSDSDSDGDTSDFNFFVISIDAIRDLCGNEEGCGGDLGGLDGADDMCQQAAANVGAGSKTWVAFLSVTDYNGEGPINAIDRIGNGPWHNVDGLLLAEDKEDLLQLRPDGDTDIVYESGFEQWPFNQCLTDEFGVCVLDYGDSHDTLTGSDRNGQLFSNDERYTCNDWTSTNVSVQLPIGHTWPRKLDSTNADDAHWIYAHECQGCGVNINLENTMEQGVGGDGGYGGFYCFAI